jgi:hypothetical protein
MGANANGETLLTLTQTPLLELDLGLDQSFGFIESVKSNNAQFLASNESSLNVDLTDQVEKDVDDSATGMYERN